MHKYLLPIAITLTLIAACSEKEEKAACYNYGGYTDCILPDGTPAKCALPEDMLKKCIKVDNGPAH